MVVLSECPVAERKKYISQQLFFRGIEELQGVDVKHVLGSPIDYGTLKIASKGLGRGTYLSR
jgi:hypothetical protein